jgi:GNAT superfamily N-acetyltransferase
VVAIVRHPSLFKGVWHSVGRLKRRVNGSAEDTMTEAGEGLELVDLTERLNDPAVQALLSEAVGYPTPAKLAAVTARYDTEPARTLYGVVRAFALLGVLGIERLAVRELVIHHIAVAAHERGNGTGRAMLIAVCEPASRVSAETDRAAVGFYARCGFAARSLGELYPDVERFECVWTREVTPTSAAAAPG